MGNSKKCDLSNLEDERKKVVQKLEQSVISFLKMTGGVEPTKKVKKKINNAVNEFTKTDTRTKINSVAELALYNVKIVRPRVKLSNRVRMFSVANDTMKQKRDIKGRFVKE